MLVGFISSDCSHWFGLVNLVLVGPIGASQSHSWCLVSPIGSGWSPWCLSVPLVLVSQVDPFGADQFYMHWLVPISSIGSGHSHQLWLVPLVLVNSFDDGQLWAVPMVLDGPNSSGWFYWFWSFPSVVVCFIGSGHFYQFWPVPVS